MISSFAFPTPILHGPGALRELPERLSALCAGTVAGAPARDADPGPSCTTRPLIVTDGGLLATPAFASLRKLLPGASVFSDVHPNPLEADVTAAAVAYRDHGCDSVIGFGGGSALDVAKIVRAAVASTIPRWSELSWKDQPGPLAPFVAIPTTAGTGSEVGRSSVITFGDTKRVIFHPELLARLVILDPEVTTGLPPKLTAATGADAIVHCIEAFTSPVFHPLCDAIAIEGLRLGFLYLPKAVENGSDLEARGMMLIAASMGGVAFQKDLGAVHSLSHPLSAQFGVHHGLANALCLLPVLRFNAQRKPGLYRRLARALDLADESDAGFIAAMAELLERVGLAGGLRAAGVNEDALPKLADAAFADGCHPTNPVPVTRADLLNLYAESL
jgi:4-hydroxybutyrate dehydrogenase